MASYDGNLPWTRPDVPSMYNPNNATSVAPAARVAPSPMNSDGTQTWNKPNPQVQRLMQNAQNGSLPFAIGTEWLGRIVGGQLRDSYATEDYQAAHGGRSPASPEELRAWQSYQAAGPSPVQNQEQANPNAQAEQQVAGVLGINTNPNDQNQPTAQEKASQQKGALSVGIQDTKQKAADAAAKGYTSVPSASNDPVGAAAAMNDNRAKGVGGPTGNINFAGPTPPTATQQQNMSLDQVGKQTAFDANKLGPWYKSNSFNYGLISFGLNLLSGNDLATSFGAAGEAFTSMYGQEQRSSWANDLLSQGYSRQEVEEYVRTGDSKVLTDPMEKQAKQIQMQTNLQTLNNLQYENSPEMRQRQLEREDRKDALAELTARTSMNNSNANLSLARQRFEFEKAKYADKQAAAAEDPTFGVTNPEARMILQQGKKFTDDSNLKRSRMAVAEEAARRAIQLKQAGDLAGAAAAYDQYEESYGKALQGGLGKINKEDAEEIAGPRTWIGRGVNHIARGIQAAPTDAELQRALASSTRGIATEHEVVVNNLQSMYENLVPKIGHDNARAAAKFQASGAGIGNWEPKATKSNVKFN